MWGLLENLRTKAGGFIDLTNGILCCAAFGGLLLIFRKYIPHPSEFFPISWLFLRFGIHKHENFNLLLDVLEGIEIFEPGKYSVRVKCGRETDDSSTTTCLDETSKEVGIRKSLKCIWNEKRIIFVRQRESYLFIELISHGTFTSSIVGDCRISIMDIIDARFPKKVTYNIQKDRKIVAKLLLSFYRISENIIVQDTNPVLFQAVINLQADADLVGNRSIYADLDNMSEKEQLVFFSKALQGNLYYLENGSKEKLRLLYFRAVEVTANRWEWSYWTSEGDYLKGNNRLGGYSFLAMSVVVPDKTDRNQIYIKYHDLYGIHDLFFRIIEVDRDIWTEAIYEFIERDDAVNTEKLNPHFESQHTWGLPSEKPLALDIDSEDCEANPKNTDEVKGDERLENEAKLIMRNIRTVKVYTQDSTEQIQRTNSPSSIRRMMLEVNPLIYEKEPLIN
ncbi:snoRNA [Cryptosporidium canis]|uniref:SnoRNA n=1 Tax=Cryptosporidium canis TaxID=195482 RepID=A0ABQ8P9M9_9CRYT|nr:snoRNA [Cryptosporidium canis]